MRYTVRPLSDRTWMRPASRRTRSRFTSSWSDTPAAALEEDYRRTARKARKVMDHLFYG